MSRFWRVLLSVCGLLFLAAVVFPIFQSPCINTANAHRASCMSNMKQLGLALTQYSQDYNNLLPPAAAFDSSGWREATYPYVKSTSVYRCPDDERGRDQDAPSHLPKSYATNALSLTNAAILDPGRAISVVDTRGFSSEEWDMTAAAFLPSTGRKLYTHKPSHYFYEHPPGWMNCLFSDGHSKAMKPMDTLTPINLWTPSNAAFVGPDLTNARAILTHAENE